ncbi:hypothetical protein [Nocardia sp. NRRL S-836]|uniref:hypothetical protein n=1 Tax=Nocardia sp. NRRL S-836 TaxID=1519492 RepID=UPI0006ADAA04|nr:hypothetical protein [Nocardia sp. NRRL S-836]KOV79283.1 hypothetical protein ADL03_37450 [Nocardia sp. NRRL S-836]
MSNEVHGPVNGYVVQARDIHGDVNVGVRMIVPSPVEVPRAFGAGAELVVGDRTYLVQGHLAEEWYSADGTTLHRRARCAVPGGHVWLRQGTAALARERDLLAAVRGAGFPEVVQYDAPSSTLVTTWPTARSGKPCAGLDAVLGTQALDSYRLYRLCGGLARLTTTLHGLHRHRVAHRGLSPDGLVELDDGGLVLRDLGLAAHPVARGEHPGHYQAPEQHMRGTGHVGPWTDVYQLAAVAHHVIAGRPVTEPAPPAAYARVPRRLADVVAAALSTDPARRPDLRSFGAAVHAARSELT